MVCYNRATLLSLGRLWERWTQLITLLGQTYSFLHNHYRSWFLSTYFETKKWEFFSLDCFSQDKTKYGQILEEEKIASDTNVSMIPAHIPDPMKFMPPFTSSVPEDVIEGKVEANWMFDPWIHFVTFIFGLNSIICSLCTIVLVHPSKQYSPRTHTAGGSYCKTDYYFIGV